MGNAPSQLKDGFKHEKNHFFIFYIFVYINSESRTIRCEVSSRFENAKVSSCLYRFNTLNDATAFINGYSGTAKFKVELYEKEVVLREMVRLKGIKNKVLVFSRVGRTRITSGKEITFEANGDTLFATVQKNTYMLLRDGINVPISNTFKEASKMKMLRNVEQKSKYEYVPQFTKDDIKKMNAGCDLFIYTRWMCYKTKVTNINYVSGYATFNSMGWELSCLIISEARYEIYNSRKLLKPGKFACRTI